MADFIDQVSLNRAYQLFEEGNYLSAEAEAQRYLKGHPKEIKAIRLLGLIAWGKNDLVQAGKHLERCLRMHPRSVGLHWDLARVRATQGEYARAIALYDTALAVEPDFIEAIAGKADVLERSGDRAAARALLEPFVQAGTDEPGMAVVWIRMEHLDGEYRAGLELAARHLATPGGDPLSRRLLYGLCARAHEKLEEYDRAFEAYASANREEALPFSPEEFEREIDALIEIFSPQNMPAIKRSRIHSELPVFIACMPRSGSTLVEQVLHAHPKAFGAGEIPHFNAMVTDLQHEIESFQAYPACVADLTEETCDRLARSYLDDIKRMSRTSTRIANKQLENWRHLAMVQLLFPGARVIHVKRDPLDNCFSCFMAALRIPWSGELDHLGHVYRLHERLMAHWHEVLEIPILDVQYEDLVEDPEHWIRRIIDFSGLEWDDRCLRFHDLEDRNVLTLSYNQVRQPIYTSAVKRYEKYDAFLGPLRSALAGV